MTPTTACRHQRLFALTALLATGVLGPAGCDKPLFNPEEPRSQYDRFDAVRDLRPPPYVFDEYGNRHPNLRGRLTARD